MPIARAERNSKANDPKKARYIKGSCGICHQMIMPGEFYFTCVGGTNTHNGYLAHLNCYGSKLTTTS